MASDSDFRPVPLSLLKQCSDAMAESGSGWLQELSRRLEAEIGARRDEPWLPSMHEKLDRIAAEQKQLIGAVFDSGRMRRADHQRIEDTVDRIERDGISLMRRLGGLPKPGFGFATLDSLDDKISTLFVGLERMGMPSSWVTKAAGTNLPAYEFDGPNGIRDLCDDLRKRGHDVKIVVQVMR